MCSEHPRRVTPGQSIFNENVGNKARNLLFPVGSLFKTLHKTLFNLLNILHNLEEKSTDVYCAAESLQTNKPGMDAAFLNL